MKKGSKEFEELRTSFENGLKQMPFYCSTDTTREPRDSHYYYSNGEVNNLFISYMCGYQAAKCLARMNALPLEG